MFKILSLFSTRYSLQEKIIRGMMPREVCRTAQKAVKKAAPVTGREGP
jgi:hypothetical protein